jgi:hypothetical protein
VGKRCNFQLVSALLVMFGCFQTHEKGTCGFSFLTTAYTGELELVVLVFFYNSVESTLLRRGKLSDVFVLLRFSWERYRLDLSRKLNYTSGFITHVVAWREMPGGGKFDTLLHIFNVAGQEFLTYL